MAGTYDEGADVADNTRILPLLSWRAALADSNLNATQRHVCLALSLYMNERGGSAFPGSARLAHDTGHHLETVKQALRAVVDAGWLAVIQQGGSPRGGPRKATVYAARIPVDNSDDRKSWTGESTTTGSPEWSDRKSWTARPEAQDFPISSLNSSKNSSGGVSQFRLELDENRAHAAPPPKRDKTKPLTALKDDNA